MVASVHFNNFNSTAEQRLCEDLIVESIRMYGHNVYYLPRRTGNLDPIYGADDISYFDDNYIVEMYIKTVDGFQGDGSFYSPFGLQVRDQVTFTIAKRVFESDIIPFESSYVRPREADLIYFPMNKRIFKITYVDQKPFFYQFGALQTYDLFCETFEYSSENFNTGIPEIDDIQSKLSMNILDWALLTEDGKAILTEGGDFITTEKYDPDVFDPFQDNDDVQGEADDILDWSESDPFSQGGRY